MVSSTLLASRRVLATIAVGGVAFASSAGAAQAICTTGQLWQNSQSVARLGNTYSNYQPTYESEALAHTYNDGCANLFIQGSGLVGSFACAPAGEEASWTDGNYSNAASVTFNDSNYTQEMHGYRIYAVGCPTVTGEAR